MSRLSLRNMWITVIHSNMWGNLYLWVFCFSWKHLSWRNLQKAGTLPWSGFVANWHSGIPFHNHENILRLVCGIACFLAVTYSCFLLCLGKHPDSESQLDGLWFEKVENEEKLLRTAWVLRNHNKNWQFKHFPGCTQVSWSSAQGRTRLHCRCWSGLEALGPLLGTWLLLELISCGWLLDSDLNSAVIFRLLKKVKKV